MAQQQKKQQKLEIKPTNKSEIKIVPKCLLFAFPGAGKSRAALFATRDPTKTVILNCNEFQAYNTYKEVDRFEKIHDYNEINGTPIDSFPKLGTMFNYLEYREKHDKNFNFDTVVVDSLTSICESEMRNLAGLGKNKHEKDASYENNSRSDWLYLGNRISDFFAKWAKYPKTIIYLAVARKEEEDGFIKPDFVARGMSDKVIKSLNVVGFLRKEENGFDDDRDVIFRDSEVNPLLRKLYGMKDIEHQYPFVWFEHMKDKPRVDEDLDEILKESNKE